MDKKILNFVGKLEGYKTAIKELHWRASNGLSQHKQCDEIADEIADFQDTVSEIEQGIHGNIGKNQLKAVHYEIKTIVQFLKDVMSETTKFYKTLSGDDYIGMRSEVETFLGEMQKQLYLINFTIKEDKERREKTIKEMKEAKQKFVVIESKDGKRVKLTESDFRNLLKNSVNKTILG